MKVEGHEAGVPQSCRVEQGGRRRRCETERGRRGQMERADHGKKRRERLICHESTILSAVELYGCDPAKVQETRGGEM